ncbi:MAG: hypothetical protein OEM01_06250 [Desulfobulbaceae bacterium]|nr:hypothetical protein [Desulfobulbaceae bacterium]
MDDMDKCKSFQFDRGALDDNMLGLTGPENNKEPEQDEDMQ